METVINSQKISRISRCALRPVLGAFLFETETCKQAHEMVLLIPWSSKEGFGKPTHLHRLARAFAACIEKSLDVAGDILSTNHDCSKRQVLRHFPQFLTHDSHEISCLICYF